MIQRFVMNGGGESEHNTGADPEISRGAQNFESPYAPTP